MTLRIGSRVKRVEYGDKWSVNAGKLGIVTGFERPGRRFRRVYVRIEGQKGATLLPVHYWERV